jgi:uncharacterized protein YdaU (DUF1376 family)
MSEEIQLPYSDLYHGDWRMGCSGFTAQQEGIYMRLYTNLGTLNGRGLPNDFNIIARMVLDHSDIPEFVEQQKADLMLVINQKLIVIDGKYHQKRQKKDREKKVEKIMLKKLAGSRGGLAKTVAFRKQNSTTVSDSDSYISIYKNIWESLLMKRGSRQVGEKSYISHATEIDPELIINKFNELCKQKADDPKYIPHFSTWLNHHRWEEELPTDKVDIPVDSNIVESRIRMFNNEKITPFLKSFALKNEQDVKDAVNKGNLTKERAKELGIEVG